jgi:predicted DNA-binding transcriptional regulator AlpA
MTEDGFYTKKQLKDVVGISMTQVDRLEKQGKFPTRAQLSGTAKTSKVGWLKKLVHAWCLARQPRDVPDPE